MKKCLIAFALLFIFAGIAGSLPVRALEMPSPDNYDSVIRENKINQSVRKDAGIKDGIGAILSPKKGDFIKTINYIIAAVALIWLSVLGGKFVLSGGEEEKLSQYKQQFGWILLGLLVVSVAEYAGYRAFSPIEGGLEGQESVDNFVKITNVIITFIQYLAGGVALLAGLRSGFALITGGDDDEVVQKEKEFIKIFLFALGLILFAQAIVTWVDLANTSGGGIKGEMITKEIVGLINFILMFLSASALFMVVLSSLYYVISLGNDEITSRAKKMIINSIIALIIAFSSYTIVGFLVN